LLLALRVSNTVHGIPLRVLLTLTVIIALFTSACTKTSSSDISLDQNTANKTKHSLTSNQSGGSFTIASRDQQSLQRPQPNLSPEQQLEWAVGKSFATQAWVAAPATTKARDGLGPLFNANSCTGCHVRNGQGQLPENGVGLILRLGNSSPEFGEQLQDMAIPAAKPEGRIEWLSISSTIAAADSKNFELKQRDYRFENLAHISQKAASARLAPALIGMGLIDNISDADIIANSDPKDRDGDGISGRVNLRKNKTDEQTRPGRFGWKASQVSLHEQIALAFFEDMGITSSLHPAKPCTEKLCVAQTNTNTEPEISDKLLLAVNDYIANLAVPAAAQDDTSKQGAEIFTQLGCSACHIPAFNTRMPNMQFDKREQAEDFSNSATEIETIYPYSDLLLHDMGAGLADEYPTDSTPANEWRTAPLWGLGIRASDASNIRLLHDGRARSITEAILWHGGEAEASKTSFTQLSDPEQTALLYFLKAL
tara:strand:- start:2427 stop:3872 length:1446 start_codon:yes stop_codon:yes gene_type:complete